MIKKRSKIILSISIAVILAIILLAFTAARQNAVDLTDIKAMNIGSEMPKILYADDNTAVLSGAFGIIEFDLNRECIHSRISFEEIEKLNLNMPSFSASADGKWIYITDLQTDKKYKCKLGTDKIHIDEDTQQNIFSPVLINQYDEKYENWFDTGYLISETVVIKKESYLYLRAKSDWSMESLQLSECDIKTNKEIKTINIYRKDFIIFQFYIQHRFHRTNR